MAKRIITVLLALLGALLAVALVYVAYVMVTYERLPDNLALTVDAPLLPTRLRRSFPLMRSSPW